MGLGCMWLSYPVSGKSDLGVVLVLLGLFIPCQTVALLWMGSSQEHIKRGRSSGEPGSRGGNVSKVCKGLL